MRIRLSLLTLALAALFLTLPTPAVRVPVVAQSTGLNRTTAVLLTNKSGGAVSYGDVVVLDNTNASSFTTTTTGALSTRGLGVVLAVGGIANNASGMVAVGGYVPRVNLNTASTVGQFLKTHTVAGQATPHSSPQVEGDFGVALDASATPAAILFGSPNGPTSGGGGGGSPGGSSGDLQYNNAGAFGGLTPGTGVTTALGVNVGSAGAFVTNGGALGTPASGTMTNVTGLPVATGVSGLGTGVATALAVNVGSAGAVVTNGGALGTPSSGTLTNATGLPVSTGISGLAAGVATALATPSSANLATAVTDETGTGSLVFAGSPTLTTPTIASFTNATHAHTSSATGGSITRGYPIYFYSQPTAGFNPADATTYYMGSLVPFGVVATNGAAIPALQSGTVTKAYCQWINNGVSGSAENVSIYVRVNDTTDTAITTTLAVTSAVNNFSNTGLSASVTAGQSVSIKIVTPTWATNPTAVTLFCEVWIDT